jgi:enamine deaminase RidA (YjgF/YER057c/UK114 family)
MRDLGDRGTLHEVWQEWYPDPDRRPPHTYLPVALPEGQAVAVQVVALKGAARRVIKVEGVEHGDPMSLAAVTGNLLTTSRIFGAGGREKPEDIEAHASRCLANASAVLHNAGLDWSKVCQVLTYASPPAFGDVLHSRLAEKAGGEPQGFVLRETDLGRGILLPRLQLLALTDAEDATP